MKFRYARHTNDLQPIVEFYTKVIGLKVLGSFENHSHYNGVFLGFEGSDWHLEFTESDEAAKHKPDEDDLLVFYLDTAEALESIKKKLMQLEVSLEKSKNPYWQEQGIEVKDPDGFGVILTFRIKS